MAETAKSEEDAGVSLKDQGNEFFKAGNYLKAAAVYTQAIKKDSSNPTLYSNRSAAFLHLVKLNKALADAEMTITLNPQWEKGYFRKGCVLEAMERYDDAIAAFQAALQNNPQSTEVSRKIKRLTQLAKEKKRLQEVESIRSNVDMKKYLDPMKSELSDKLGNEELGRNVFDFIVQIMEAAIKGWHETGKLDAKVNFLLDKEKTQADKYAPVVNIDKAFESPHTHSSCFSFLRQYAEESFAWAACLVVSKSSISYPQERMHIEDRTCKLCGGRLETADHLFLHCPITGQVWKGQGSRKWKHGQLDGFFVQFESPVLRKLWFVASSTEKGRLVCRDPEDLDVTAHELLPRIFRQSLNNP